MKTRPPHEPPTQSAIARALGLSPAAMTKLKKLGMPTTSIAAAAAWRAANIRPRIRPAGRGGDPERQAGTRAYQSARTAREQSEARRSAIAARKAEHALVSPDVVRTEIDRRLSTLRESLQQLPGRLHSVLAAEADEAKVHEILQDHVYAMLARVAEAE